MHNSTIQIHTPIPGPKSQAILARRAAALPAGAAKSTEIVVDSARGAVVTDIDGNTLLDFAGGIGMLNVGHAPESVQDAIRQQVDKFIHACQIVTSFEAPIELAEMLNSLTPGDFPKKTLLANSGSEAVENAVNIARYATGRPAVVVFEGAYHGRTLLTMSLTSKYGLFKKGYGAMASDIYRLPLPNLYRTPEGMTEAMFLKYNLDKLEDALIAQVDPSAIAAILIEPVQGEGGFVPVPAPFLQKLRDIADRHGIVLIFDEIQCGMMRTGKLFACEHAGVVPDMITIAKSLGAGMPVAAVTGKAEIMDKPHLGAVGGTYSGSPVACAAALAALRLLTSPEMADNAKKVADITSAYLKRWEDRFPFVGDGRSIGAMNLVEFVKDKKSKTPDPDITLEIIKDAVSHGVILIRAGLYSNCIRLLPPLVITEAELNEGLTVLENAIERAANRRN